MVQDDLVEDGHSGMDQGRPIDELVKRIVPQVVEHGVVPVAETVEVGRVSEGDDSRRLHRPALEPRRAERVDLL